MKDEFLATLSHELRTPLNAILGWSQVLSLRAHAGPALREGPELREGLESIDRNARAQARLIEDLLDLSRIAAGKIRLDVRELDPVSSIDAAVLALQPAADEKGIDLRQRIEPEAGTILADPDRLQQIVSNLLSNAIKFTGPGGRVEVSLRRPRDPQAERHAGRDTSEKIEIAVSDTGVGIAPEFLPYVFDRFSQADASPARRHGGLGIGLAIVRQLAALHGGVARAESAGPGRGARFSVELPAAPSYTLEPIARRSAVRTPQPDRASLSLAGMTVLVVDDEVDARTVLRRILADLGAEVVCAASAEEALELIPRREPMVLVCDISMPGQDGYDLIRAVRALRVEDGGLVPAIALTALARPKERERVLLAGYQMHLAKPVDVADLAHAIAAVVARAPSAPSDV
jgi:CheY-like chemotaxis protein/two-component sensor histidine kinase